MFRRPPLTRSTIKAVALGACACLALASCSSSATKTAAGGSASSAFTGAPVKVEIDTFVGTQFGSYAGSIAAVKAAARAINAGGGIHGHQVLVQSCNTQASPNQETACGRNAVANGVVATVGSLMLTNGADYLSVLDKAGIADIASEIVQPVFAQAANSYPVAFGFDNFAACTGPDITNLAGGKRIVSTLPDVPTSTPLKQLFELGAKQQGSVYAGNVAVPTTVSDYTPIVQQIGDLNPNVVDVIGGAPQFVALLHAAALTGRKFTFCTPVASAIAPALASVGAAADKFYVAFALPPLSASSTISSLTTFKNQMAAEVASGDKDADVTGLKSDPNELQTWLGMQVFAQVANAVSGPVTAQSFQAQLKQTAFSGLGIVNPIDFGKPATYGSFTRVFNPTTQLQKWSVADKQFELAPNTAIDGAKLMFGPPS